MGLITQSGSISSGAGAKAALVIPANFSGKEPRPSLRKRPGSCKTQLMLETHTHTLTHKHMYLHTQLSLLFIYAAIYGQCNGKALSHTGLLNRRQRKRGHFSAPEALPAPQQPGLGVSSPAEPSYAQHPHHGAWCQGRTVPMPHPRCSSLSHGCSSWG